MAQKREFPTKIYGRFTNTGAKAHWTLYGYRPEDDGEYPHAGVYTDGEGGASGLTEEGLLYGIQNGHILPLDGTEVLTWGKDIPAQFERIGIRPLRVFDASGYKGPFNVPSVYWMAEAEFVKLDADPEENWEGKDAAWRWADGSNLDEPEVRASVNGHWMTGWKGGKYRHLTEYLCNALGVSTEKNIAAVAAELAQAHLLSIGALFTKYQPVA